MTRPQFRLTVSALAASLALSYAGCTWVPEDGGPDEVPAPAVASGDHPELYGPQLTEDGAFDIGGTVEWSDAPWPGGVCLVITQGPSGSTHDALSGCPVDLDDGCYAPGHAEYVCGFDLCRVETPCRSGAGWGINACLVDVATGRWQFIGHMLGLASGVVDGSILTRGASLGWMGNTGNVYGSPGCTGAGTHLHYEEGAAGTTVGGVSSCPWWPLVTQTWVCSTNTPSACAAKCGNGKCVSDVLPADGAALMVPGSPAVYRKRHGMKHRYSDEACFHLFHESFAEAACVTASAAAQLVTAPDLCAEGSFVRTADNPTVWAFTPEGQSPLCGAWTGASFEQRYGYGFSVVVEVPESYIDAFPQTWGTYPAGQSAPTCAELGCGYHQDPEGYCWGSLSCGSCTCSGPATATCGSCGVKTRTCSNGQWSAYGACTDEGVCSPGQTAACGVNGTKTCTSSCGWGDCVGQSCVGSPTATCGSCGVKTRTCSNGQWSAYGACTDEGVCSPGQTAACGVNGTKTCTASCGWGSCVEPPPTSSCSPFVVRLPVDSNANAIVWWPATGGLLTTTFVPPTGGTFASPSGACAATMSWPGEGSALAGAPTGTATLSDGRVIDFCALPGGGWGVAHNGDCRYATAVRFDAARTTLLVDGHAFALHDGTVLANAGSVCAIGWALGEWAWHHQEEPIYDSDGDGWYEYPLPVLQDGIAPYPAAICPNAPPTLPFRFSFKRCSSPNAPLGDWLSYGGPGDWRTQAFAWRGVDDLCNQTGSLAVSWSPGLGYWASGATLSNAQ